jgi:hypothetical protein
VRYKKGLEFENSRLRETRIDVVRRAVNVQVWDVILARTLVASADTVADTHAITQTNRI